MGSRAPTDNRLVMANKAATGSSPHRPVTRPRRDPTARPRASTASRAAVTASRVSELRRAAPCRGKGSFSLVLAGRAVSEGGLALFGVLKHVAVLKGERALAGFCLFSLKIGSPGAVASHNAPPRCRRGAQVGGKHRSTKYCFGQDSVYTFLLG